MFVVNLCNLGSGGRVAIFSATGFHGKVTAFGGSGFTSNGGPGIYLAHSTRFIYIFLYLFC